MSSTTVPAFSTIAKTAGSTGAHDVLMPIVSAELDLPIHTVTEDDKYGSYLLVNLAWCGLVIVDGIAIPLDRSISLIRQNLNGMEIASAKSIRQGGSPTDLMNKDDIGDYVVIDELLFSLNQITDLLAGNWQQIGGAPISKLIEEARQKFMDSPRYDEDAPEEDLTDNDPAPSWFTRRITSLKQFTTNLPKLEFTLDNLIKVGLSLLMLLAFSTIIFTAKCAAQVFSLLKVKFVIDGLVFANTATFGFGLLVACTVAFIGVGYTFRWIQNSFHLSDGIPQSSRLRLVITCGGIVVFSGLTILATTLVTTGISHYLHH